MTREEAIKILDPETTAEALSRYLCPHVEIVEEACRLAVTALRAQAEPNTPLTPEELREMDGEPVWIQSMGNAEKGMWSFVDVEHDMVRVVGRGMVGLRRFKTYGKTWLACRRKPENVS